MLPPSLRRARLIDIWSELQASASETGTPSAKRARLQGLSESLWDEVRASQQTELELDEVKWKAEQEALDAKHKESLLQIKMSGLQTRVLSLETAEARLQTRMLSLKAVEAENAALRAKVEKLTSAQGEKESLKAKLVRVEGLLKQEQAQAKTGGGKHPTEEMRRSSRDFQAQLEVWKHRSPGTFQLHERPFLKVDARKALLQCVPKGHVWPCTKMQQAVVTSVQEVANMNLWKQYLFRRQQAREVLAARGDACPRIRNLLPEVARLEQFFPHMQLDHEANEVLLFHGTTPDKAAQIIAQGFDDRLSNPNRSLYGTGIYFSIDSCKMLPYCLGDALQGGASGASGCIILVRAVLGHPYMAVGPMEGQRRPPLVEGVGVPHDSVIAQPGIPNGWGGKAGAKGKGKGKKGGAQVHWEFVLSRGDVYPELLINFRL